MNKPRYRIYLQNGTLIFVKIEPRGEDYFESVARDYACPTSYPSAVDNFDQH